MWATNPPAGRSACPWTAARLGCADDNGQELRYEITDNDGDGKVDPVKVKNLTISFTDTQNFHTGDNFDIVPKRALYWIEPTRGPENVTPQRLPQRHREHRPRDRRQAGVLLQHP